MSTHACMSTHVPAPGTVLRTLQVLIWVLSCTLAWFLVLMQTYLLLHWPRGSQLAWVSQSSRKQSFILIVFSFWTEDASCLVEHHTCTFSLALPSSIFLMDFFFLEVPRKKLMLKYPHTKVTVAPTSVPSLGFFSHYFPNGRAHLDSMTSLQEY